MYKIMFVCHGNICRSPMAEYLMREMLKKEGIEDVITASAATSFEEIGNGVHGGTVRILARLGIDCSKKRAVHLEREDYDKYDLILGMDRANIGNITRICGGDREGKIKKLLDFSERPRDISDPWYTGDFEKTYEDVREGCEGLIRRLKENGTV